MQAKLFEIRDRATFIPILAVHLEPELEADRFLLAHAGYGTTPQAQAKYIYLIQITGGNGQATCDPYDWAHRRTYIQAHQHIIKNWNSLNSGDVIDIEFTLGETKEPKKSEALL